MIVYQFHSSLIFNRLVKRVLLKQAQKVLKSPLALPHKRILCCRARKGTSAAIVLRRSVRHRKERLLWLSLPEYQMHDGQACRHIALASIPF